MAAAAGGIYAVILLVVTPQTVFGALTSAQALIVTLFGGVGIFWGPVIGASILIPLAEMLHAELGHILPGIQGVVYGVAIIVIILAAPDGIYWKVRDRIMARRAAPLRTGRGAAAHRADAAPIAIDAAPRPRVRRADPGARQRVARLRRPQGGRRGHARGAGGHDLRHHRAERRRQDHAVQRASTASSPPTRAACGSPAARSAG